MPIDQSRMYALIDAAETIETAHITTCHAVSIVLADLRAGKIDGKTALKMIETYVMYPEGPIARATATIEVERMRYRLTHKENERNKIRKAAKRAEQGLENKPIEPQGPDRHARMRQRTTVEYNDAVRREQTGAALADDDLLAASLFDDAIPNTGGPVNADDFKKDLDDFDEGKFQ